MGEVEANDEKTAIKKAHEEFHIPPERQIRLALTKLDYRD
jgi:hypothetical protein